MVGYAGSNGYYSDASGNITSVENLSIAATTPVRYDASTRTFTYVSFEYLIPPSQNGPISLQYDESLSSASFSVYRSQPSGINYLLRTLNPGLSNPVIPLLYSSLAIGRVSYFDPTKGVNAFGITPMVFGTLFDWGKVKLTGKATYSGLALGQARGVGSHAYEVSGTFTTSVDYDTTDWSGRIQLVGHDEKTGEEVSLGEHVLIEMRPRGVLDFFIARTADLGNFQGRLAGAGGEEMMAAFDATMPDPRTPGATLKATVVLAGKRYAG